MCIPSSYRVIGPITNLINKIYHIYESKKYKFICSMRLSSNHSVETL
jgi:hypothetical protein